MQLNTTNPVLSMSNAIRKKHNFFDGGRGVPQMEKDPDASLSDDNKGHMSPPPAEQQYTILPDSQPVDYSYSPPVVYSPTDTYSSTNSLLSSASSGLTSGYGSYEDLHSSFQYKSSRGPSAFTETTAYATAQAFYEMTSPITAPSSSEVSSSSRLEDDGSYSGSCNPHKKKKKRRQRCRMCANHGVPADVKGHKWKCPHRDCKCSNCHITRKTQYYMKERQKFVRKQQQFPSPLAITQQSCLVGEPEGQQNRCQITSDSMEFPRRQELISETADIIEPDLFAKINEVCRPKSSSRVLVNNRNQTGTKQHRQENYQSYGT